MSKKPLKGYIYRIGNHADDERIVHILAYSKKEAKQILTDHCIDPEQTILLHIQKGPGILPDATGIRERKQPPAPDICSGRFSLATKRDAFGNPDGFLLWNNLNQEFFRTNSGVKTFSSAEEGRDWLSVFAGIIGPEEDEEEPGWDEGLDF